MAGGDFALGRARFEAALARDPDNPVLHYNLGLAYHRLEKFGEAVASYDRALALQPDSWLVLMNRGIAYSALSDTSSALADLDSAAIPARDEKDVFFNRALVRGRAGSLDGALDDLRHVIALDCNGHPARLLRTRLLRHLGHGAEAEADIAAARRIEAARSVGREEPCDGTSRTPAN